MGRPVRPPLDRRWRPTLVVGAGAVLLLAGGLVGWVRAGSPPSHTESGSTGTRAATESQRGPSGIRGTIFFTCSGAPGGESPQCARQQIKARQDVYREGDGRLIARFMSSSSGKFKVELPAGTYLIAQPRTPYKGMPPCFFATTPVRVPKHRFVALDLFCDNGVR
jgi:hypothetical protein